MADIDGNKLTFTFDTGNGGADLTDLWFSKNADTASAHPTDTLNIWGHGGTVQHDIVKIPEYTMTIGDASVTFNDIPAVIPSEGTVTSSHDGNLGISLLRKFSKVIFNFEDMFVAFE